MFVSNDEFRISECSMEWIIVRLLEMLALDRFDDFISGNNATAPVREAAAQALSIILLRHSEQFPVMTKQIFAHIHSLFELKSKDVCYNTI